MKYIYYLVVVVVLAFMVWGYLKYTGKESYQTTPIPTQETAETTTVGQNKVSIKNLSFSPANLEISRGTKVTWTNEDSVDHTVTSIDNRFDSGNLTKGEKFEFTFTETGEFSYHCTLHPNMAAKIIVR